MRSGHGLGKSWISAKIAITFLILNYPSKIVTTAPTWFQVEKILWTEIRKSYSSASFPIGGRILDTELKLEEDWFAIGISTKEGASGREFGATRMQGFHSPNLLVILDEAAGVSPEIWKAVESLVTGQNNKVLAIGNPASPTGDFYECFKSPVWSKVHLSCLDHPNVVNRQELVPGCVTWEWVEERKKEWGEDSPLYKAKVLGEFPDEGEDTLIPLSWAEGATKRQLKAEGTKRFGGDIARYGSDRTVFYEMVGPVARELEVSTKQDTMVSAGKVKRYVEDNGYDHAAVDDAGVGGGVTDRLNEQGVEIDAVNFGESAIDSERFANVRAEAYWLLREGLNPKSQDPIQIPDDPVLVNELTCMKFSYTSKGQIKIESKDDIKKRLGRSPDKADALAICNYAGRKKKEPNIRII